MNFKKTELKFSPSEHHKYLMGKTEQILRFQNGNFYEWKDSLKSKLKELLGEMPSTKCPLDVRTLLKRKNQFGNIEKIVYTSEPYCDVPAYLCIPDKMRKPEVLFICLQGHSTGMHNSIAVDRDSEEEIIHVAGDRDFAIGCMKRGIAALCIEQRSMGLRRELVQAKVSDNVQALMLGRTLLGERLYDIERGLDFLKEKGYADWKVGIMENSGGGTTSIYAAALFPEISYAMPSCSFGLFQSSKMAVSHCLCGYVPNLLKYAEMSDIMGLFAPKPVVIVAGKDDDIIPLSSVMEGFSRLKNIYRSVDAEKHCHLVVGSDGHRFYADKAWNVMINEF